MTTHSPTAEAAPTGLARRYTAVAIALHWAIAAMILGLLLVGWVMEDLAEGGLAERAQYQSIVQIHKSVGITVLLLSIARIAWRLMNPPPPAPAMAGWQAGASRAVHILFYVLMIAMPLSGWIMASASGAFETRYFGGPDMRLPMIPQLAAETREVLEEIASSAHSLMAWLMAGLMVLHIAGALKHQFADRDGLLARMAPGLFGRTAGPPDDGQGAIWAFGAAGLLFAVIAGLNLASGQPATGQGQPDAGQQAPASAAPAWTVDYARSRLAVRFTYMGRPYEGVFPEWTADIRLDTTAPPNADSPADGAVRVAIPVGRFSTGEPYFDDSLSQPDWFNAGQYPEAVFEVKGGVYRLNERDYEATGVLQMKGLSSPVRLPFSLDITGQEAVMHAEVGLSRLNLGVGAGTKAAPSGDEEWVGETVTVVIDLVATRQ
jgi:cytochrome b561/polyisoprenoid-binding protein YceI